jgi:dipeptidyl aminopeptidase/acylaminoacyl peptidase
MRVVRVGPVLVVVLAAAILVLAGGVARAQVRYQQPPKAVVDILDAKPLPDVAVSPSRQVIALLERRSMPSIADLSQPMLRLAGTRINPKTNGRHRPSLLVSIALQSLADGRTVKVAVPAGARLEWIGFSPDSRRVAFAETKAGGVSLWIADAATGGARLVPSLALNTTMGRACSWLGAGSLLCQAVPAARGAAPRQPATPEGPNVQESAGKAAPVSTYEDLLKTPFDEALFEYYFTSQLVVVNAATLAATPAGAPGIFASASASPSGEFLMVERVKRPFSHFVPYDAFPHSVEIWTGAGKLVRVLADLPSAETVPMGGVAEGPREFAWNPVEPATVVWAEALDGGDLKRAVPHRDRLCLLAAPFAGQPSEWLKLQHRLESMAWTSANLAIVGEFERATRMRRVWMVERGIGRLAWQVSAEDRYKDPGEPASRPGYGGGPRVIMQVGDIVYLAGDGASPQGDRPFLDRFNVKTSDTERIFQSEGETYEVVMAVVSDNGRTLLTRRESVTRPPNYLVRDLAKRTEKAVTNLPDPAPQLSGVRRQFITYQRKDGVSLSAQLYLPPGYQPGQRLPLVMWAYPMEFTDPAFAGQVTGSPYTFTAYTGASHMFFLTQGYAVLDNPSMPIVGPGETANDTYVDQLVASAQAAIDKVVALGVADRDRIGVGGHSYGAFMTANLLAHSRLFRAGIALSGAYNRTLTPFGFQSEQRTFWEVPDVYARMSPFWYANSVKDPILLMHGERDNNSGTFPIQSERFYMALKGHGATVRYVTLPNEAHSYQARESVLHTLYEMFSWFDKYVRGPSAVAGDQQ